MIRGGWIAFLLVIPATAKAVPESLQDSLQAMIDSAAPGSVLEIPPGRYVGNFEIRKPLTLEGHGAVELNGQNSGTVLKISGEGVTLSGFTLRASGAAVDAMDAALLVEGNGHRIEKIRIEDSFYGIILKQANRTVIRENRIQLRDQPAAERGDAIRLWYSMENEISDNEINRARDISFANSPRNRALRNRITESRIGFDLVFSPETVLEENVMSDGMTGIVVLYSNGVVARRNRISHMNQQGSVAITLKESLPFLAEGNEVFHCAVAFLSDAPDHRTDRMTLTGNRFAHNTLGVRVYGRKGSHVVERNTFEKNLIPVAMPIEGDPLANRWHENLWDDYEGFDRDGDGFGDTPYENYRYADRIWQEIPQAQFFANSPFFEMLDFLERLAPFSKPDLQLRDDLPRMK